MAAGKERGLRLEAGEARARFLPGSLQKERGPDNTLTVGLRIPRAVR